MRSSTWRIQIHERPFIDQWHLRQGFSFGAKGLLLIFQKPGSSHQFRLVASPTAWEIPAFMELPNFWSINSISFQKNPRSVYIRYQILKSKKTLQTKIIHRIFTVFMCGNIPLVTWIRHRIRLLRALILGCHLANSNDGPPSHPIKHRKMAAKKKPLGSFLFLLM